VGSHQSADPESDAMGLFAVGELASCPLKVEVLLDGKAVTMEVNTGAAVLLMPEQMFRTLFPQAKLSHSELVLKTFTGERMEVVGERSMQVCYGATHPQTVNPSGGKRW